MKWLTPAQVAAASGLAENTIRRQCATRPELEAVRDDVGWLIPETTLRLVVRLTPGRKPNHPRCPVCGQPQRI
jgi:hypothetical protein